MMYIIKDNQPQSPNEQFFLGKRQAKAPNGQQIEIADFGTIDKAHKFRNKEDAASYAEFLNRVAGKKQFSVEKVDEAQMSYGMRDFSRGKFKGFEKFKIKPMQVGDPTPSDSDWVEASNGNGFTADEISV